MHKMGIEAFYREPNTSKKHPGHAVYPYLLRCLKIERANHVWAIDARTQLAQFIDFYSKRRPHSALASKTPDEYYFATLPAIQQAA